MKTLAFTFAVSAALVVAFTATPSAQAMPNNAAPPSCSFSDLTGVTVTACSGFYSGNLLQGGTGADAKPDVETALTALGLTAAQAGLISYVEKIDDLKLATPSNYNNVDFAKRLYGDTIVGFHLGGGSAAGNATAFYRFDAGAAGVDVFSLNNALTRGATSGAAVLQTAVSPIPEPGSYALMLAGLSAVGLMTKRRRSKG